MKYIKKSFSIISHFPQLLLFSLPPLLVSFICNYILGNIVGINSLLILVIYYFLLLAVTVIFYPILFRSLYCVFKSDSNESVEFSLKDVYKYVLPKTVLFSIMWYVAFIILYSLFIGRLAIDIFSFAMLLESGKIVLSIIMLLELIVILLSFLFIMLSFASTLPVAYVVANLKTTVGQQIKEWFNFSKKHIFKLLGLTLLFTLMYSIILGGSQVLYFSIKGYSFTNFINDTNLMSNYIFYIGSIFTNVFSVIYIGSVFAMWFDYKKN